MVRDRFSVRDSVLVSFVWFHHLKQVFDVFSEWRTLRMADRNSIITALI